jgi:hypothetical protein
MAIVPVAPVVMMPWPGVPAMAVVIVAMMMMMVIGCGRNYRSYPDRDRCQQQDKKPKHFFHYGFLPSNQFYYFLTLLRPEAAASPAVEPSS